MNHSPAPWEMDEELAIYSNNQLVCTCGFPTYSAGRSWNEAEANATLISAAPDMADALLMIASYTGKDQAAWRAKEIATAALIKAGIKKPL